MSNAKQRKEKNCLNCGTIVAGRYCQHCGQENIEPKETVWALVSHFFYDITHFDGKFFSTAKLLLTRPGFLSREYIAGRRASYLHPIRMYVFTSAFFFIIFFSLFNPKSFLVGADNERQLKETLEAKANLVSVRDTAQDPDLKAAAVNALVKVEARAAGLQREVAQKREKDSLAALRLIDRTGTVGDSANLRIAQFNGVTVKRGGSNNKPVNNLDDAMGLGGANLSSRVAYDAVQEALPAAKKDSWFERGIKRRAMSVNMQWKADRRETVALLAEKFVHTVPQALFVSLPVFALILLLLYARRNYLYVDHAIFSIHLYCATFVIMLLYFGFDKLSKVTEWGVFRIFAVGMIIGIFVYQYKAMRGFYQQGRAKTIAKYLLLNLVSTILLSIIASLFVFWVLWGF